MQKQQFSIQITLKTTTDKKLTEAYIKRKVKRGIRQTIYEIEKELDASTAEMTFIDVIDTPIKEKP